MQSPKIIFAKSENLKDIINHTHFIALNIYKYIQSENYFHKIQKWEKNRGAHNSRLQIYPRIEGLRRKKENLS